MSKRTYTFHFSGSVDIAIDDDGQTDDQALLDIAAQEFCDRRDDVWDALSIDETEVKSALDYPEIHDSGV